MTERTVLLIDCGDLASLAALAVEAHPKQVILWRRADEPPARAIIEKHGRAFPVQRIVDDRPPDTENSRAGLVESAMLLRAATAAIDHQAPRVVWPIQIGPDAEAVSRAVDLANTTADLIETATGVGLSFELPVVHLTDAQLVDLADEAGAPMQLFWCCRKSAESPCGACDGCRRWKSAFEDAERTWPWVASAAPS